MQEFGIQETVNYYIPNSELRNRGNVKIQNEGNRHSILQPPTNRNLFGSSSTPSQGYRLALMHNNTAFEHEDLDRYITPELEGMPTPGSGIDGQPRSNHATSSTHITKLMSRNYNSGPGHAVPQQCHPNQGGLGSQHGDSEPWQHSPIRDSQQPTGTACQRTSASSPGKPAPLTPSGPDGIPTPDAQQDEEFQEAAAEDEYQPQEDPSEVDGEQEDPREDAVDGPSQQMAQGSEKQNQGVETEEDTRGNPLPANLILDLNATPNSRSLVIEFNRLEKQRQREKKREQKRESRRRKAERAKLALSTNPSGGAAGQDGRYSSTDKGTPTSNRFWRLGEKKQKGNTGTMETERGGGLKGVFSRSTEAYPNNVQPRDANLLVLES
ncbi:hypothetical protein R1flu_025298 [Riccia fluitans]|uniref:Uncharacterized protein n=1 Tax=Riccia fluitans TaxID=41844 RepID=A0ABD1Y0A6_9MARC